MLKGRILILKGIVEQWLQTLLSSPDDAIGVNAEVVTLTLILSHLGRGKGVGREVLYGKGASSCSKTG